MTADTLDRRDHTFLLGLLTGTLIGAGVALWFHPRSEELRQRMSDAARDLSASASDGYRQASTRVGEAVDDLTKKGQSLRRDAAETIVRGAHEAERVAAAIDAPGPIAPVKS